MLDLTGATERRATLLLALLVTAVLLVPVGASAQIEPISRASDPAPTATPTPTVPPIDGDGPLGGLLPDGDEAQPTEPAGEPTASPSPSPSEGPGQVEAEGDGAHEVVAPPSVPQPDTSGDEVSAADGSQPTEVASAAPPDEEPAADDELAAIDYGPQIVPSLGTATAPLTNDLRGFDGQAPLVMAPQVAGQQVVTGGQPPATTEQSAGRQAMQPAQDVAAASLTIVQPSWFATATALLILLAAASYAALLRRRGVEVPAVLAVPSAIRPRDSAALAARSVRPTDIGALRARSIRP